MSKLTTLNEFIMKKQADFPGASGELSRLLNDIAVAAKIVTRDVRRAGLVDNILGAKGEVNVQGEQQQKLDVVADNQFIKMFELGGEVCGIGSEENEAIQKQSNGKNSNTKTVIDSDGKVKLPGLLQKPTNSKKPVKYG